MRIITIIFEDDELGVTHTKVYEAGNGSGETEGELKVALAMRATILEHNAKLNLLTKITLTGDKPGEPEDDLGIAKDFEGL